MKNFQYYRLSQTFFIVLTFSSIFVVIVCLFFYCKSHINYDHHKDALIVQIPLNLSCRPFHWPSLLASHLDGIQCLHRADECKRLLVSQHCCVVYRENKRQQHYKNINSLLCYYKSRKCRVREKERERVGGEETDKQGTVTINKMLG